MALSPLLQTSKHAGPTRQGRAHAGALILLIVLALIAFVPGAVFFLIPVPSHSIGLLLTCITILGMMVLGLVRSPAGLHTANFLTLIAFIAAALSAHVVIAALFVPVEFGRALQSVVLLAIVLASAAPIAGALREHGDDIDRAAAWLRLLFVVIALLGLARIQPPPFGVAISEERSVFPFAEPSHFALTFAPFLVHACARLRGLHRIGWLVAALVLAYVMKSLSLVVGVILAAVISLPILWLAILGAGILTIIPFISISYFTDRMNFALSTDSLSSLVYRQGWELATDAAERTSGWGIGFQQLGFAPFSSPAADILYLFFRNDTNLRDGGFLTAKLLSELGIFGALLTFVYVALAARAALRLRRHALDRDPNADPVDIFARAMIYGVAIEMAVRGLGYFSGSMLLCICSCVLLATRPAKRVRILNRPEIAGGHLV